MIKIIDELLNKKQVDRLLSSIDYSALTTAKGVKNLSKYEFLRKDKFDNNLNETCKRVLPKLLYDNFLQIHILKLPKGGLLDKQSLSHMHNLTPPVASFVSIPLNDDQQFIVDGVTHKFKSGDCIVFDPEHPHEIKPVKKEEIYIVIMIDKVIAKSFADEY